MACSIKQCAKPSNTYIITIGKLSLRYISYNKRNFKSRNLNNKGNKIYYVINYNTVYPGEKKI